jgi:hypothetical protein
MPSEIPEGILIPNNEFSVGRNDIDPMVGVNPTVGSPDQGQSNGTGSFDGLGMDLRNDTIQ